MKRLFCWALSVSFLGSLPLGTLNLSVANYAFQQNTTGAVGFSLAAIFVEVALVRLAAAGAAAGKDESIYLFFRMLTCGILLLLAGNSLLAAWQMETFRSGLPVTLPNPVLSGFVLSLINPLHLPFWLGWTALFRSKNLLDDQPRSYNIFVLAVGLGTGAAFFLYGFAGGFLIQQLGSRQVLLNWIVGVSLLITAGWQIYRAFYKKAGHGPAGFSR